MIQKKNKNMKKKKTPPGNILVVDDEQSMRDSMHLLLKDNHRVHLAQNGREAIKIIKTRPIDLVLLDIRLPETDGLEVLKVIKGLDDSIEVIMITAVITVKHAVEAIRHGAYDYITKPFDIESLQEQVEKVLEKRRLEKENSNLRNLIERNHQFEKIIGKSEIIQQVFRLIEDVAQSSASVLITGESGTGKELVAHAIHNRSPRKDKLFVAVNCAAIPENLLESELFGHERGSFTGAHERQIGKFEVANHGTLLLDEIGAMPLQMQAKLLRAIQEKEIERIGSGFPVPVDVRIIAATNSDLLKQIKKCQFREDLYYRLNVVPIHLPPLRERKEDIPLLANHFLGKFCREFGRSIKGIDDRTLALLSDHYWPGNVRELENLIERLVVLTKTEYIDSSRLPSEIRGEICETAVSEKNKLFAAIQQFEADFIRRALDKVGGKKGKAADLMGIHRNTLIQLERKLKLQ